MSSLTHKQELYLIKIILFVNFETDQVFITGLCANLRTDPKLMTGLCAELLTNWGEDRLTLSVL